MRSGQNRKETRQVGACSAGLVQISAVGSQEENDDVRLHRVLAIDDGTSRQHLLANETGDRSHTRLGEGRHKPWRKMSNLV
jgi:hypothetical protein